MHLKCNLFAKLYFRHGRTYVTIIFLTDSSYISQSRAVVTIAILSFQFTYLLHACHA